MVRRGGGIRVVGWVRDDMLCEEEAVHVWDGLISGRWFVVESMESDGRRFILAQVNDFQSHRLKGLSKRERQVASHAARGDSNKTIAYALGLAPSTIATHLTAARKKLGVGTRLQLVEMFARLGGSS